MANALLVVDIQQFYLPDLPSGLVQNIVNHHKALNYDVVAFSVFRNNPDSNFVRSLKWSKCSSTEDAALPSEFNALQTEQNVFERDTYSAFQNTNLHNYLQENNVDRLVLCGVDSDACVLATAFDAFDLGYHVKFEFELMHSSADLQDAARAIMRNNLASRD